MGHRAGADRTHGCGQLDMGMGWGMGNRAEANGKQVRI